jgi:hypothetical protein
MSLRWIMCPVQAWDTDGIPQNISMEGMGSAAWSIEHVPYLINECALGDVASLPPPHNYLVVLEACPVHIEDGPSRHPP